MAWQKSSAHNTYVHINAKDIYESILMLAFRDYCWERKDAQMRNVREEVVCGGLEMANGRRSLVGPKENKRNPSSQDDREYVRPAT